MAEKGKEYTNIEIKQQQPPTCSSDFTDEESIPLFKSGLRKGDTTWIISLFVVIHFFVFAATMFVNDCSKYSHGDCALKPLGRFSFQPLYENPLLGPSASTLDDMGAFQRSYLTQYHLSWRLLTCLWLHAGAIHLIVNLCCVVFIGIQLEQEFGSLRIGVIYICSGILGVLVAALFVENSPVIGSSGALFGLIGAMLSALIRDWGAYTNKLAALIALFSIAAINIFLGLLPYVDNFSNIGGLISGFLLGFVLLYDPRLGQVTHKKEGLFEYGSNVSIGFKQKMDMPVLRIVSLVLFTLILGVGVVALIWGTDANKYCSWCHYTNCIPTKLWSCNDKAILCKVINNSAFETNFEMNVAVKQYYESQNVKISDIKIGWDYVFHSTYFGNEKQRTDDFDVHRQWQVQNFPIRQDGPIKDRGLVQSDMFLKV
ncbi:Peptidase S54, rhomboid domain [Dillenia turbinata]|uniref:RHOMBOID-like protein n=1 Tax=Dillenia turbinata TaxID=194707 RepID=A0AAN8ZG61_9MAGN